MRDEDSWLGLFGHHQTREMLGRAMRQDALHHALLVSGPAGIGKKTLARAIAAARLCPQAPMKGCGTCNSCQRVLHGNHSDFAQVGPSGASQTIARATVQASVLSLQHAPHEASHHLTIFAPADRMTVEAANALLKTLEEPRPGVMLVLITQRPHAVLPTLKSRSLHLPLRPLSRAQTQQALRAADPDLDLEALAPLMDLCPGQPGKILAMRKDPGLKVAQSCVQTMQQAVDAQGGAAEIFASPQSALWTAWEALVKESVDPQDAMPAPEDPVQKIGKSSKKKKARKKGSAATKKKPSSAQQRRALRTLSEVWLSSLRGELRQAQSPDQRQLAWKRTQALLELSAAVDRNVNPRLLLERVLLDMLASSPPR